MHGENDNRNNNGIDIGKTAVAIEYVPGEAAPKILATGKGVIADKIIERAKESNVPTYKDDKLADTLARLKIGDMIPTELYEVVAEILVFVNDLDKLKAKIDQTYCISILCYYIYLSKAVSVIAGKYTISHIY